TMPLRSVIESLRRLPHVGTLQQTVTIPARTDDHELPVLFRVEELQRYSFSSAQDLVIGVEPGKAYTDPLIVVEGGEPYVWTPSTSPIGSRPALGGLQGTVTTLYITNESDADTE